MITLPKRQEVYMKYSMRRQFALMFIMLITGTILLCFILNTTLLGKYYINNKKNALVKAYYSINQASIEGDITSDEYDIELRKICEKYNIHVLVADGESETVKASMNDPEVAIKHLFDNIFCGVDESKLLLSTENYKMQFVTDYRTQTGYLEMWGVLDNGYFFLLRSALESIQESVKISNRFLAYVGFGAVIVSALLVIWLSNRITKPILELADISERMKHLDFEAKYTGKEKTEISVLGNNINELSETLEATISELKTVNNELLKDIEKKDKIDEMRKEFLSNVSHELKTPIALIQGYAEGLSEGIADDDPESRTFYCEVIMDEAAKMNSIVSKLLTLNELEFGSSNPEMKRFDLTEFVGRYLVSAAMLAQQKDIRVEFDDSQPVYIWGDEDRIAQVIENFFSNAVNHCEGEKKIHISVTEEGEHVRCAVFNTGVPIPEDSLPHLWDKFYKVDKARSREYGGSGVGLSIVKAIVESMNGTYGVRNVTGGVEFWFEL